MKLINGHMLSAIKIIQLTHKSDNGHMLWHQHHVATHDKAPVKKHALVT